MRPSARALILFLPLLLPACGRHEQPVAGICLQPTRGCSLPLGGMTAEVRFSEAPKPLRPFQLSVTAPRARQVTVQLGMQGMDMGVLRYTLARGDDGLWRADVILPVCIAGRSDWLLTLEVDGERSSLSFAVDG